MQAMSEQITIIDHIPLPMGAQWRSPRAIRRSPIGAAPGGDEYTRQVQRQISRRLRKMLRNTKGQRAIDAVARELNVSADAVTLTFKAISNGAKW